MRKFFFLIVLVLLVSSCGNQAETEELGAPEQLEFDVTKLPKLLELNQDTQEVVDKWINYKELESTVEGLYVINNNEELILLIENALERQNAVASAKYPPLFDTPQVKSRQKVFKTFILKVKATLEYRKDPIEPTIEMLEAFNTMRNQFDVLMNSQIDTKNIFDD